MFKFLHNAIRRNDRKGEAIMKKTKVGEYQVYLTAKYGEYNCGNKTVGRLELIVDNAEGVNQTGGTISQDLEKSSYRDKIIKVYLDSLSDAKTFVKLCDNSPMFPNDTGTYPPGVLIYADRIHMNKAYRWWNNWKSLIEVFETEPKFGVVVLKSPIIPNKYYGTGAPSRIWTLVLPSISEHICYDKKSTTKEMLAALTSVKAVYSTPYLNKELESLGVA